MGKAAVRRVEKMATKVKREFKQKGWRRKPEQKKKETIKSKSGVRKEIKKKWRRGRRATTEEQWKKEQEEHHKVNHTFKDKNEDKNSREVT